MSGEMETARQNAEISGRHLKAGWFGLAAFLCVGLVLEALHGFKIGFYTQPGNHWRREMWTLAHAHGGLISVVNIVFALCVAKRGLVSGPVRVMGMLLVIALVTMPLGFWMGGLGASESDPGVGIVMVPVGGVALVVAVVLVALNLHPDPDSSDGA